MQYENHIVYIKNHVLKYLGKLFCDRDDTSTGMFILLLPENKILICKEPMFLRRWESES